MEYKIESGIAMPKYRGRPRKYPLDEMTVGDSFAISHGEVVKLRNSVSCFGIRNKRKYSIRCIDPVKREYRCWMIA